MDLKLYDTLTRKKRLFSPLDPANVRMYVCGPTVYDFAHIGNARPAIVFDVLFWLLQHLAKQGVWDGGKGETKVTYVRNITDVDDKINARAAQEHPDLPLNEAIRIVTEKTERQYHEDVDALGCLRPTVEPRATEFIRRDEARTDMVRLIERLIANGNGYVAEEHVLFHVPSMKDYGRLSKRSLDEMVAGARVEVAPYKRDPMDFVLWKPSKPGEPAWPSPAGIATPGRPGWHIECSAMSAALLGETFDIHGGGIDLVFPHHENEIAQSRCAFHTGVMANTWMHNGFLQVEGEKMSKSLGNFFTIRQLRKTKDFGGRRWNGNVLRFAMLQTHYSEPIDWTVRLLEQSEARLERWKDFAAERTVRRSSEFFEKFIEALAEDLNTPAAFGVIEAAIESASDEDRYAVYKAMKFLKLRTRKTRTATVAEQLDAIISKLGTLSANDWNNLSRSVFGRSTFKSGALKPETKLFASLKAIGEFWKKMDFERSSADVLDESVAQLMRRVSPAESEFELTVRRLILERSEARKIRNFAESDRIRDELAAMGVVIKDSKDGTTWEVKR